MCQHAEGESGFLMALDRSIRRRGFEAYHAGVPLEGNPERTHTNPDYDDSRQWAMGWRAAAKGDAAPW